MTVKSKDRYVVEGDVNIDLDGWVVHLVAKRGQAVHTLPVTIVATTATESTVAVTLPGTLTRGAWETELVATRGDERITFPTDQDGRPKTVLLTIARSLDD